MRDPTDYVGVHTLTFNDLLDSSGRAYPITPQTPVVPVQAGRGVVVSIDPTTGTPIVSPAPIGSSSSSSSSSDGTPMSQVGYNPFTSLWDWLTKKAMPAHLGSRTLLALLGLGILLIVAFRLTK